MLDNNTEILRATIHNNRSKHRKLKFIPVILSFIAIIGFIDELGFNLKPWMITPLAWLYVVSILAGIVSLVVRYIYNRLRPPAKVWVVDLIFLSLLFVVLINYTGWMHLPLFSARRYLLLGLVLVFLREFSTINLRWNKKRFNPAHLFIGSYVIIIFSGSLLLMLPNATVGGLSFLDALFTSTSAVCVTGLMVYDTGTYFTEFGQSILLILIQIGGLGIMTFTSYFSYLFTGGASYENQLLLSEMTNSQKLSNVFVTLKRIIILTVGFEIVGAVLIYYSLDQTTIRDPLERIYFSVFHSISSFCNAGFSTIDEGLYNTELKFNYSMQMIVASLFIMGGIGFPILFNMIRYGRYMLKRGMFRWGLKKNPIFMPWIINLNSKLVFVTTGILLVSGSFLLFVLEYDNALEEHGFLGKIVTAFFGAATPRSAGFNSMDIGSLTFPALMLILLLMWIGSSPASTGGGIKTSTFAIATLNVLSHARGKDRIDIFGREIAYTSVQRAFAIIALSLMVIGMCVTLLMVLEPQIPLLPIVYESFAAYSTSGISLGITPELSKASRVIIMLTMFVGRMSMLTVLVAILRKVNNLNYDYPREDILIN